ncbi:hypothetical protein [Pseudomonas sp. FSL R10-1339]|uniref:hypothetical protein n=1 Tax=Pseudomonas sp. FSL R10-1339 TaxID=2662196 RepID=UPI001297B16F|nr:hypothetical protein [Pseudomonas sp. FSL R10-1339]MQU51780.1 hypothetical protein [Pseudomonas sp. FSL R10-1339]
MTIKNFVVISQRIKNKAEGLIAYLNYLENEKSPSHKNTEIKKVFESINLRNFLNKTIQEVIDFDRGNKKGGRKVESYAQSFNFVLPPTVERPTIDQWKKISADLLKSAKLKMDVEGDLMSFVKSTYLNVHDQKNPHLNLVIPRIYKGKRLEDLDRKGLIAELKKEFNTSVLKHCQINYKNYKPTEQKLGRRRKQWQVDQDRYRKERDALMEQRLELAQTALEASQLIELSETAKKELEAEKAAIDKAKADANRAKVEAEQAIGLMAEMTRLYKNFKASLSGWAKSLKEYDHINEGLNKNEVIDKIEAVQNHEKYDNSMELVLFHEIEQVEKEVEFYTSEKKPISNKVRRKHSLHQK